MEEIHGREVDFLQLNELTADTYVRISEESFPEETPAYASLLVISNEYGYFVAGTPSGFTVGKVGDLRSEFANTESQSTVELEKKRDVAIDIGVVSHIKLTADEQKLLVATTTGDILIYDAIGLFQGHEDSKVPERSIKLGIEEAPLELLPNPSEHPTLCAVLLQNGHTIISDGDNPTVLKDADVTAISWSPKGKQLACGFKDGSIKQYGVDGSQKAVMDPPHQLDAKHYVGALKWVDNLYLLAVYVGDDPDGEEGDELGRAFIVSREDKGKPKYIELEEINPYFGNPNRALGYHMQVLPSWGSNVGYLVFSACSRATDVAVIGQDPETKEWATWLLDETARAILPLAQDGQGDTAPMGLAIDLTSDKELPSLDPAADDSPIPPVPIVMYLNNEGMIGAYNCLNVTAVKNKETCAQVKSAKSLPAQPVSTASETTPKEQHTKDKSESAPKESAKEQQAKELPKAASTTVVGAKADEKAENGEAYSSSSEGSTAGEGGDRSAEESSPNKDTESVEKSSVSFINKPAADKASSPFGFDGLSPPESKKEPPELSKPFGFASMPITKFGWGSYEKSSVQQQPSRLAEAGAEAEKRALKTVAREGPTPTPTQAVQSPVRTSVSSKAPPGAFEDISLRPTVTEEGISKEFEAAYISLTNELATLKSTVLQSKMYLDEIKEVSSPKGVQDLFNEEHWSFGNLGAIQVCLEEIATQNDQCLEAAEPYSGVADEMDRAMLQLRTKVEETQRLLQAVKNGNVPSKAVDPEYFTQQQTLRQKFRELEQKFRDLEDSVHYHKQSMDNKDSESGTHSDANSLEFVRRSMWNMRRNLRDKNLQLQELQSRVASLDISKPSHKGGLAISANTEPRRLHITSAGARKATSTLRKKQFLDRFQSECTKLAQPLYNSTLKSSGGVGEEAYQRRIFLRQEAPQNKAFRHRPPQKSQDASFAGSVESNPFAAFAKQNSTKWTCPVCLVPNDQTASQCMSCETPNPSQESKKPAHEAPSLFGFKPSTPSSLGEKSKAASSSWASAGFNFSGASENTWICPVCAVSNKANAPKCVACETDTPNKKAQAPASGQSGFSAATSAPAANNSWAASGFKFSNAAPGSWTCPVCAVSNPPQASKCVSCETDNPATSKTTTGGAATEGLFKPASTSSFGKPMEGADTKFSLPKQTSSDTGFGGFNFNPASNVNKPSAGAFSGFDFGTQPAKPKEEEKKPSFAGFQLPKVSSTTSQPPFTNLWSKTAAPDDGVESGAQADIENSLAEGKGQGKSSESQEALSEDDFEKVEKSELVGFQAGDKDFAAAVPKFPSQPVREQIESEGSEADIESEAQEENDRSGDVISLGSSKATLSSPDTQAHELSLSGGLGQLGFGSTPSGGATAPSMFGGFGTAASPPTQQPTTQSEGRFQSSRFGYSFGQSASTAGASTSSPSFTTGTFFQQQPSFGTASAPTAAPAFGSTTSFGAAPAFGSTTSFGAAAQPAQSSTPAFGQPTAFGAPSALGTGGKIFGGGPSSGVSSFGQGSMPTQSPFGSAAGATSGFGSLAQQSSGNVFGGSSGGDFASFANPGTTSGFGQLAAQAGLQGDAPKKVPSFSQYRG
ncbi:hypothetical protein BZG36_00416 [Bifiguratus adelaidae]|uniref:Nuclear pore complex protein Nup153 n=1 Tax=Bifiguratus adelaidae TaxID=1938954 RepID=A0A261Y836_9FUNG|nr:hypothetical protein BZG36_00416 [Bifiguratus adelaidae]